MRHQYTALTVWTQENKGEKHPKQVHFIRVRNQEHQDVTRTPGCNRVLNQRCPPFRPLSKHLQWQPAPWPSPPASPHPREPLGCPCASAAPSRSASRCRPAMHPSTLKVPTDLVKVLPVLPARTTRPGKLTLCCWKSPFLVGKSG